jgi:HEAT repeat protein
VRSEAINYLTGDWGAQFPEERQQAIPLLIKLQSDVDKSVRESATNGLKEINGPSNTKSRIR